MLQLCLENPYLGSAWIPLGDFRPQTPILGHVKEPLGVRCDVCQLVKLSSQEGLDVARISRATSVK